MQLTNEDQLRQPCIMYLHLQTSFQCLVFNMHYTCFYVVYGGLVIRLDPETQAAGLKHSTYSLTGSTKQYTIFFFFF